MRAEEEAAAHADRLRACFREGLGAPGQGGLVTELQAVAALSAFLLFNSGAQCLEALPALSLKAQARVALSGRSERTAEKPWRLSRRAAALLWMCLARGGRGGPLKRGSLRWSRWSRRTCARCCWRAGRARLGHAPLPACLYSRRYWY